MSDIKHVTEEPGICVSLVTATLTLLTLNKTTFYCTDITVKTELFCMFPARRTSQLL